MDFLESGYPIWVAKQTMLRHCDFGKVLILGDSRAEAAIVPAGLPFSSANITFGGTTPAETYFFAREALKCPQPPQMVVYSHSMPAYMRPNEGLWKTATRYGYINFRNLRNIADVAEQDHDSSLEAINTHDGLTGVVRDVIYGVGFPSIFMASLVEARGVGRYNYNKVLLERTAVTRGQVVYADPPARRLIGIDADVKAFTPSSLEADYFDKTLNLFAAAHVTVVLLTVPVSHSTLKNVVPQVVVDFSRFLGIHTQRYQNVIQLTPRIIAWPDDVFVDGSHMNERGAKLFTRRLASCLLASDTIENHPTACSFDWK